MRCASSAAPSAATTAAEESVSAIRSSRARATSAIERDARGSEHAGEEEPAGRDVPCGRLRREGCEGRHRHPATEPDGEGEHARLRVAVLRDDRPADGVRAAGEIAAEGQDERPAHGPRAPREHGAAPSRIASLPGPTAIVSSKTTRTSAGALGRTAESAGTVSTRIACAAAVAGRATAMKTTAANRAFTSGDIAATLGTVAVVLFRQFVDDDLGCASYLIGDERRGRGRRRRSRVRDRAVPRGGEAPGRRDRRASLETHTHADHVSGHGRLALEHGVPVSRARAAGAGLRARPARGRRRSSRSATVASASSTRPATDPSTALRRIDRSRADEPWLVLTGDSLFVGDAARPDLAVEARDGAEGALPLACTGCSSSATASRSIPATSPARSAAPSMSSTAVDDDRLRAPVQRRARPATTRSSWRAAAGPQPPRPPNMERDRRAQPRAVPRRAAAARADRHRARRARSCSTSATRTRSRPATGPARSTFRCRARRSRRRPASSCPERPLVIDAARRGAKPGARARRLAPSASSTSLGWRVGGGDRARRAGDDRRARAAARRGRDPALDVREADERDAGFIPGSCTSPVSHRAPGGRARPRAASGRS